MRCESSDVVRFDLGLPLQGQTRIANLKSAYNSLIKLLLVLEVCNVKPTCRKSWTGNLLVVRFDLGLPLQGQTRIANLKSAYKSANYCLLIIGPRGLGW